MQTAIKPTWEDKAFIIQDAYSLLTTLSRQTTDRIIQAIRDGNHRTADVARYTGMRYHNCLVLVRELARLNILRVRRKGGRLFLNVNEETMAKVDNAITNYANSTT